jgi:hypothetical protein
MNKKILRWVIFNFGLLFLFLISKNYEMPLLLSTMLSIFIVLSFFGILFGILSMSLFQTLYVNNLDKLTPDKLDEFLQGSLPSVPLRWDRNFDIGVSAIFLYYDYVWLAFFYLLHTVGLYYFYTNLNKAKSKISKLTGRKAIYAM